MENLKYEYYVYTWGGFYNKEYSKIHKKESGGFWFDSEKERKVYIEELKSIEKDLSANYLMISLSEGYCCRIPTILHRVIEFENKRYYSKYDLGINYPLDVAQYHLENKWYCGFNDYPLGEDFDYENNEVIIVQEWITGAYQKV